MTDECTNSSCDGSFGQRIAQTLQLLQASLPVQRRMVHAGDKIYRVGQHFGSLHVVSTGMVKVVNLSADGREQVVALHFRGDWLGLEAIATGFYACDAVAMDTGEVWSVPYAQLLDVALCQPQLLRALHDAMSRQLARDHESLQSLCALPTDARVASFLHYWADAMDKRGLRTDQISLHMTRAEIGNYLGMTLESVSRALSRLARCDIIRFLEKGRREIHIPRVEALDSFVRQAVALPAALSE